MSAGTISTGNIPRLLQEGVHTVFGDSLKEWPVCYNKIFKTEGSTKAFEVSVQLEGFGLATTPKNQGDDISFDSRRQGFTPKFIHSTYAKGYIVTEEALDDELYGQLSKGARALAKSMMLTREQVGANVLNNGFDSTVTMTDGDGAELFDTAHSSGPSGLTYSNRLAVDADLSEASLEDMLALLMAMDDARGLPANLSAQRLIVAANTNVFNAQRILGSVLQNDTANNATNAVRDLKAVREGYFSNPYLTDADAWFLISDVDDGLIHFDRKAIAFGQDNAFTSGNARFKASYRDSFGWIDARGAFGSQGA